MPQPDQAELDRYADDGNPHIPEESRLGGSDAPSASTATATGSIPSPTRSCP